MAVSRLSFYHLKQKKQTDKCNVYQSYLMLRRQATAEPEIWRPAPPSLTPAGKHNTSIWYHINPPDLKPRLSQLWSVCMCIGWQSLMSWPQWFSNEVLLDLQMPPDQKKKNIIITVRNAVQWLYMSQIWGIAVDDSWNDSHVGENLKSPR